MSVDKQPVVFMGTPAIAAYVLDYLLSKGVYIAAVVTAPDKPSGRGRSLKASEVKQIALKHNLNVLQPENLNDHKFIKELKKISPAVQVVVAFRKLPAEVWQIPFLGTFNMHASYLPDYRGAAPINWVIINGEKYTGVTTFFIDDKIDTGKILLREKIDIKPTETAGSLHEIIKVEGAKIADKTLKGLLENKINPINQNDLINEKKYLNKAPKIYKEDCRINWNKSCNEIVNLIRGLNPLPGAFTEIPLISDKPVYLKIFEATPCEFKHNYDSASILSDNKNYLKITTPNGAVDVKELQMPGKKRIDIKEFLKGNKVLS